MEQNTESKTLLHNHCAFIPSSLMAKMEFHLQRLVGKGHSPILFEAGKIEGRRLAESINQTDNTKEEKLKLYFSQSYLGELSFVQFYDEKKGASFKVNNSFFALGYKDLFEKSPRPTCDYLRGIFVGLCEEWYQKRFICRENQCLATLQDNCTFSVFSQ